jgi:acetyl-CoA carboxylase biotin carboxyl carrier protein
MQEMTKLGLTRVKLEKDNFKLELEKNNNITSDQSLTISRETENTRINVSLPSDDKENRSADKGTADRKMILAPMVGTFYAQPGPDKPPYVSVGDKVKKGQPVCIIEAMKLMNEIESEVEGEIIECLVENEEMVEFGQPLYIVK